MVRPAMAGSTIKSATYNDAEHPMFLAATNITLLKGMSFIIGSSASFTRAINMWDLTPDITFR